MRDMKYELALFRRMEGARVHGQSITDLGLYDGTTLWQRFHQTVFDGDVKRFARTKSFSSFLNEERQFHKPLVFFLTSCVATLSNLITVCGAFVTHPRVLIFSVDKVSDQVTRSDFRLRAVYDVLSKNHVSYTECFHTLLGKSMLKNILSRKRLALYLEGFDWMYFLARPLIEKKHELHIEGLSGTEDEVAFMSHTISKYVRIRDLMAFRRRMLVWFLRAAGVKAVVGIDDVRHYHEVLAAARACSIPSLMVQHGHFTKYHVGWLGYQHAPDSMSYVAPDALLVWSNYWKQELLRLGSVFPSERIIEAGYPNTTVRAMFSPGREEEALIILVPHETESPKREVSEYIRRLAHLHGAVVYLKIRPDLTKEEQLATYDDEVQQLVRVVTSFSEMPVPSVACGVYTTLLYDMVREYIPTLVMQTNMDYGEGIVANGLADTLSLHTLEEDIRAAHALSNTERALRAERLGSPKSLENTLLDELRKRGVV